MTTRSPITVHAAGHFHYRRSWVTERANPSDHLMVWVIDGMMDVTLGGRDTTAAPGDLVLLPPGVPHRYRSTTPEWQWLWLHCDGAAVPDWWRTLSGRAQGHPRVGPDPQVRSRFSELVTSTATAGLTLATSRESIESTTLLRIDSCAHSLIGLIMDRHRHESTPTSGMAGLSGWVLDHLDAPITVAELADRAGWSVPHLHRVVRDRLGTTPMRFVTGLRMERAQRLLAETDLTIGEIATLVGYGDPLHFSRRFRQFTGRPPSLARAPR